jgi:hypothetical protein
MKNRLTDLRDATARFSHRAKPRTAGSRSRAAPQSEFDRLLYDEAAHAALQAASDRLWGRELMFPLLTLDLDKLPRDEKRMKRNDDLAAALYADVLPQLAELARVPEVNRNGFSDAVFKLVFDAWRHDDEQKIATLIMKRNEALSRAIGLLRSARQALADLDKRDREALRRPIFEIEMGMDRFFSFVLGKKPGPTRQRARRSSRRQGGRHPGTVKNRAFQVFVRELLRAAQSAGGTLTLQKNLGIGTLIKAINALAPRLPDGFVPKPLSVTMLQRIKSG